MLVAQYRIPLPADYDMAVIHRRVAERGHALDDRKGLALKAYLVRDVAAGEAVNEYAPLYLWRDPEEAARFFWGGAGFAGIVQDFGRPLVETWIGDSFVTGPRFDEAPQFTTRIDEAVWADADPTEYAGHARLALETLAADPALHSAVFAVDPARWTGTRFALWAEQPSAGHGTVFRILHLSTPELRALTLDAALPSG